MKAKCFNCGEEFDWERPEEDYQLCDDCGGTGEDGIDDCPFCRGSGIVDLNADEVPICEDCLLLEEEREYEKANHHN